MLDTEHEARIPMHLRGTRWEIHPVMRVETLREGAFVSIDDLPEFVGLATLPAGRNSTRTG